MDRNQISINELQIPPFRIWEKDWLLLTSGDFSEHQFNCMTIGWGSIGIMWGRPFIQVVVRPQRYTYTFMEKYPSFTVCAFPKKYRSILNFMGTKSGRDIDKMAFTGITPEASEVVAAPSYTEAVLIFECIKIYWDDLDPNHFMTHDIQRNYPLKDYHRIYFGEIVAVQGSKLFQNS